MTSDKMRRRSIGGYLFAVIVLIAAGTVLILSRSSDDETNGMPGRGRGRVAVEVEAVRRADMEDMIRVSGSMKSRFIFTVSPRISGFLEELRVDIGDTVRNGDLIAVLDSEEYEQQVVRAEAELEVARANASEARQALNLAQRERDRVAVLLEEQVASESEFDAAEARFAAAEARVAVSDSQVRQREAGLETARLHLSYTRIHAHWDGNDAPRVVGERHVYAGTMMRAHEPIVSIVDLDRLTAVVHVVERDYPRIAVGQPAVISADALPEETFRGEVVRVAPLLSEASRQARVEIDVPNPGQRLRPGMFVKAHISFDVREDVCVVPATALVRRNGVTGVFQVDAVTGEAAFVPVKTGIRDFELVQIVEPELSGDVVTLGQHLLQDGAEVVITDMDSPLENDTSPAGGPRT